MQLFPFAFGILSLCGFWRPIQWTSRFAIFLYNCFTVIMIYLIFTFTLSEVVDVFVTVTNLDEFAGNSFMMLSMINVCFKMMCIVKYRKKLLGLMEDLQNDPFRPRDANERDITKRFTLSARSIAIYYATLTETTVMSITVRSFFGAAKGILAFRAWLPYNWEKPEIFWPTFFHQTVAHVAGGSIQVANESWIVGMMLQISAQLQLLKYRFENLSNFHHESIMTSEEFQKIIKKKLLDCIRYHNKIIKFADILNQIINIVIFVQFSMSSLIICLSVYLLSKMTFPSPPFFSLLLYLSCMLIQIFLYCWYGNEVLLQSFSIEKILNKMDWLVFQSKTQKMFILLMIRAVKPIIFTSNFMVTLSVDSFTKILKTAYSVFNVLTQSE